MSPPWSPIFLLEKDLEGSLRELPPSLSCSHTEGLSSGEGTSPTGVWIPLTHALRVVYTRKPQDGELTTQQGSGSRPPLLTPCRDGRPSPALWRRFQGHRSCEEPTGQILQDPPRLPSQSRSVAFGSSGESGQDPPAEAGDGAGVSPRPSGAGRAGQAGIRARQRRGQARVLEIEARGSPWPRRGSGRPGAGPRVPLPHSSCRSSGSRNRGRRRSRVSMADGCGARSARSGLGAWGAPGDAVEGGAAESPPLAAPSPSGTRPPPGDTPSRTRARPGRALPPSSTPSLQQDSPPIPDAQPQDTASHPGCDPWPSCSGGAARASAWVNRPGAGWGRGLAG